MALTAAGQYYKIRAKKPEKEPSFARWAVAQASRNLRERQFRKGAMDELVKMKGRGRTVLELRGEGGTSVKLLRHDDGSWSITRNGTTLSVWEAHEADLCLRSFLSHADRIDAILIRRHDRTALATDAAAYN
jgi:hypothetical protein